VLREGAGDGLVLDRWSCAFGGLGEELGPGGKYNREDSAGCRWHRPPLLVDWVQRASY